MYSKYSTGYYKLCFGSGFIETGSGSRYSILGWIPIRIQGFDDQKLKKLQLKKIYIFVIKNCNLLGLRPVVRATGEYRSESGPRVLMTKNWKSYSWKKFIFLTFFYFCGSFLLFWIRIRILNPDPPAWLNLDLVPKHCKNRQVLQYSLQLKLLFFLNGGIRFRNWNSEST